jgi:hypothetical protein
MKNQIKVVLSAILAISMGLVPSRARNLQSDIRDDEYAVYSAVIESKYGRNSKLVVVRNRTINSGHWDNVVGMIKKTMPPLPQEMLDEFKIKNKESYSLSRSFKIKAEYVLIDVKEINRLFDRDINEGWKAFYRKYPDSPGDLSFSRVVFNADMSRGFVYVSHTCGSLCGDGTYFSLVKENGDWKVEKQWTHWVS